MGKRGPKPRLLNDSYEQCVIRFGDDECWGWLGCRHDCGYGITSSRGKNIYAHRLSWLIHKGAIPDGLFVMHKCHNPICSNPKHLELGTQKQNMEMSALDGRIPHKIPRSDLKVILNRRLAGETYKNIAASYQCCKNAISEYLNRHRKTVDA